MPKDETAAPPLPEPTREGAAAEMEAITKITDALIPLKDESRRRTLLYVHDYFRINRGMY